MIEDEELKIADACMGCYLEFIKRIMRYRAGRLLLRLLKEKRKEKKTSVQ